MTNPAILEALAARMWKAQAENSGAPASVSLGRTPELFATQSEETRSSFLRYAAAVLELVGPRPLVWEPSTCSHLVWICQGTTTNQYRIALDDIANEYSVIIDGCLNWHNTLEAAQAAAQAHADAAHLANTAIGKLMGAAK